MAGLRLTMAQALVRYLAAQQTDGDGQSRPLFAGVWAIFGHGNVAGLGEALWQAGEALPTYRAHNEQAMAHAAIAFAKASQRRQPSLRLPTTNTQGRTRAMCRGRVTRFGTRPEKTR